MMSRKSGRPLGVDVNLADTSRHGLARRLLKEQLVKSNMGYDELSCRLKEIGTVMSAAIVNRKINRGTFSADFLLQCLTAMGIKELRLGKEVIQPPAIQTLADQLMSLEARKGKHKW